MKPGHHSDSKRKYKKRRFIKIGDRFNRFTVQGVAFLKKKKKFWECKCDCGNIKAVRTSSLVSGDIKSCGCLWEEKKAKRALIRMVQAAKIPKTTKMRFEEKYMAVTESGCWVWLAAVNSSGYGNLFYKGRNMGAHRVAWLLFKGEISDGQHVLHRCDTPPCVNPSHLFLGSHQDNMQDCAKKKRFPRKDGEHGYNAKLKNKDVLKIRQDKRIARLIAQDFDVSISTISHIKTNRNWRSI